MKQKTRDPETGEQTWNEPDSEATVEQVQRYCDLDWKEVKPINYWKYACIAILLGTVAGMLSLTPKIIEVIDVCTL